MPMPKLFGGSSSRGHASENDSRTDTPANNEESASRANTTTPGTAIPEYSDSFKDAWAAAHRELPKAKGAEKILNKIESVQGALTLSPGQQTVVETLAAPAKALIDASQIAEKIHKGVDAFMEAVPPLMGALDEVAKIHPFIGVAVIAFKAVYTLEKKRSENDKRVLALYVEIKDMMTVLLDLNGVNDLKKTAPDGTTIEGRIQKLCEDVAEDIKQCANACDTYLRKKLLVKVFAGPIWEGRLLKFVGLFTDKRKEFGFALTLHTVAAVDSVVLKLGVVDQRTAELSQKMDVMQQLFKEFINSQQRELAMKVEGMGGKAAALENEQAMKELVDKESELTAGDELAFATHSGQNRPFNLVELQQEINSDPDKAIEEHAESFNRKFDLQKRIVEDLGRVVRRDGDRVIYALTAGPHDRIVDPDIHLIWKDMGWRGSVKARRFVMSLRDHFIEKVAGDSGSLKGPDGWALKYINIGRAPSILEAFDDDASGFVTTREVNDFTKSRPLSWGLPCWIAYWAIGWQMTCTSYCVKIEEIFDAMIRLSYEVLPENRRSVNDDIQEAWQHVASFTRSIEKDEEGTAELRSQFESYVAAEEARLQRNFEAIRYRIDGSDTVRLVSGEGRPEATLFPMFYLTLKRDLEKISLARKHVLSDSELPESLTVIWGICGVALQRIASLRGIFKQQNLEAKSQFQIFAKGLYKIPSENDIMSFEFKLPELEKPISCRDELIPDPDSIPLSILNYPPGKRLAINLAAYDPPEAMLSPSEGTHPLLGTYYGFIYQWGDPIGSMMKFSLSEGEGERTFVAAGAHYKITYENYQITGTWGPSSEDGKIPVEFKISYYFKDWLDVDLKGVFDPVESSLRGTTTSMGTEGEFVFKRDSDLVRFCSAPSVTDARKRWEFVKILTLDRVRRQAWSSKQILKGIKDRRRFIELTLKDYYGRFMTWDEMLESAALSFGLREEDVRVCASIINIRLSKTVQFSMVSCDNCRSGLEGSRIICMDCSGGTASVDLCSKQECVNSTVTFGDTDKKPHLPSHWMFKVHRFLFNRDRETLRILATNVLGNTRMTLLRLKKEGMPLLGCLSCKAAVSMPCWCCTECVGPTQMEVICDDCEQNGLAFNDSHTPAHAIVRISEEEGKEQELSTQERLRLVEDELAKMRQNLVEVTKTVAEVTQTVSEMKQALGKLVERSGEWPQSGLVAKGDLQTAANEVVKSAEGA